MHAYSIPQIAIFEKLQDWSILQVKTGGETPEKSQNYFGITWFRNPLAVTVFLTFIAKLELMISNQLAIFCQQNPIVPPLAQRKAA